jgi:aminoglycoside phosphotransferase (APT) family kinase protein
VVNSRVDGRAGIDAALVRRLVAGQFPQWRGLPVTPVELDGWDNRTYRLGSQLSVRLPTGAAYVPAVAKEHRWLPVLAAHLPVPIPTSVAIGRPGEGYPFEWSIRRWLTGQPATLASIAELSGFAIAVAEFLLALQRIDAADGPAAGAHSFYRGASLAHYDVETQQSLGVLASRADDIDIKRAASVWDTALAAEWHGPPRWFHGDVAAGNLLVRDGRLAAVLDFGTCGVGDPACDLVIAWTMFGGASRQAFRQRVDQDAGSWARARGWALWKALITLAASIEDGRPRSEQAANRRIIADIAAEQEAVS